MTKEKYNIEYNLNTISPSVLWNYLSSPQGLENWFADQVSLSGKKFTFFWNKTPQTAEQISCRTGVFVRYRWSEDQDSKQYFEFRIHQIELTGNTILEITDYAEPDEKDDSIDLWNTQVEYLKHKLGIL